MNGSPARTVGPVRIVGTGLIGTSIGLGLTTIGVEVQLWDASPSARLLAEDLGAGRVPAEDCAEPKLIVVCVPPDVTASVVAEELQRFPNAVVTDVASVKAPIEQELRAVDGAASRYVGSHPMAGSESGGPLAGRADLFLGRPWVIAPDETARDATLAIEALVLDLGAEPVRLSAADHDRAVALISHAPQVVASLLAARLLDDRTGAAALAGQGLRDTTRIAASDPVLWTQILGANASSVAQVLRLLERDVAQFADALEAIDADGSRRVIASHLRSGNEGVQRIPSKHGQHQEFVELSVLLDDSPGQLARLFADIGDSGINIEDVRMDHAAGAKLGTVQVSVLPDSGVALREALLERGWRVTE